MRIEDHFLFQKDFFRRNFRLFDVYFRNTPEALHGEIEKKIKTLAGYEETMTWPVIRGPGFCGATHPGAGKSFNAIMTDGNPSFYNSDCLYIHPGMGIFAVSDPPGVTTISRRLFEKLDSRLARTAGDHTDAVIDELAAEIPANLNPTLALIRFQKRKFAAKANRANVYIAGDTAVYRGNFHTKHIEQLNGSPHFWGTACRQSRSCELEIGSGDFFVIVSDGIGSLRQIDTCSSVEEMFLNLILYQPDRFAEIITGDCNRVYTLKTNGSSRTLLGGTDDITVLLLIPSQLDYTPLKKGCILGGFIG
ncbi:MAG: hypothetical protein R6U50_10960 [Desulfobacterales bacterium]